ncbi:DNA polymerase [Aphelenchoides bicaudatus]|nr:DNA polymerase [Aphelenchoides bicaudatus]
MKTKHNNYNISTAITNKPSPFVNLLALNIVGVPSPDNKETEVIMISGLYRNRGVLDRANNRSQNAYETFCFMTNPKKGVIPLTFDVQLKNANIKPESVQKVQNERVLLNLFFAKMKQIDPDIITMHDSHAQLSLLISRVEKYTIRTWHFISRLAQYQQPGRLFKTKAGQWELVAGRSVLCSKTASEELYPTKSYELGDLIALLLPEAVRVPLTFAQITETFTSHKPTLSISQLIRWSWLEAYFALQIVFQLNALPLFVQITQIVGGVLSRTLFGGRAERNEYLLLHAFYESDYIPPDKYQYGGKKGQKTLKEESNVDEDETKTGASRKAQYTGGLVLEPKKGFYDSYIVLLDFNSLYPSIIQEFNICFTTIDRCYEEPNEKGLPEPPRDSIPEGILSIQIGNLVRNRREVKVQMQKVKPGTDEYMRLDVRQKGLKLTANSMYGCLGFGMSRFCAKTLAAMITSKGRELLSRTKDLVEERGYSVVYGDTDSIMVNTNTSVHGEACRLAFELRKVVNGGFKHVEMDVDGLFKRLLLLKKKKYAALTVSLKSDANAKKEMKGLDIVRRDWSKLAKDVGERVVDLILNSKEREDLVNEVVSTLSELAENLKAGKIPVEDFEILKQLTKAPKEYGETKSLPHVMVAQRLNADHGFHLRQGDVVKYVICQDGTSNSAVQRAYHLSELANNENLAVDGHYYLSQQVHPVVMRLCETFDELDSGRIAEALGLDPVGYRTQSNKVVEYSSYNISIEASADYDQCDGFKFKCSECAKWSAIRSPFVDKVNPSSGLALKNCPECKCRLAQQYETLKSSFIVQLNSFISKHATAKFVCDDHTCAYQTNDSSELIWTSSQGPTCPQCKSTCLRKEFSLRDLFYQQKFFYEHIFNLGDQEKSGPVVQFYNDCKKLAFEHLKANSYNRVNLGRLLGGFNRLK